MNIISQVSSALTPPLISSVVYYLVRCFINQATYTPIKGLPASYGKEADLMLNTSNGQHEDKSYRSQDGIIVGYLSYISTDVYSEYLQFIMTMLVIHIGMRILMKIASNLGVLNKFSKPTELIRGKLNSPGNNSELCESKLQKLRKVAVYTSLLVIKYSLMYFFYCIIYASIYIACQTSYCPLYSQDRFSLKLSGHIDQQRGDILSLPGNLMVNSLYPEEKFAEPFSPVLRQDSRKIERGLDSLDASNAIELVSSLSIPDAITIALSDTQDIAMIATSTNIIPIDISSLTSPVMLQAIKVKKHLAITYVCFSPNLDNIFYMDDKNNLYLKNIKGMRPSMPLDDIHIDKNNSKIIAVFTSNNTDGFFITSQGLYQFDIRLSKNRQLLDFAGVQVMHLKLSADEKNLSIGLCNLQTGDILLYVIAIPIDVYPPIILANYTISGQFNSLTTSSDNRIVFLLEEVPSTEQGFVLLNIIMQTSPIAVNLSRVYSAGSRPQKDRTIILAPNDRSIVVYSKSFQMIWDSSDLNNIPSGFGSPMFFSDYLMISPNSEFVFAIKGGDLQIGRPWVNVELGRQLSFINPRPIIIPTNGSAYSVALSSDGKKAYVAGDKGLEVFQVDNSTSMTYQDLIPTTEVPKSVMISHDYQTMFVLSNSQLMLIDAKSGEQISAITMNIDTVIVSPDGKTLILKQITNDTTATFKVADISSLKSPRVQDFITLPKDTWDTVSLALNEQFLFLAIKSTLRVYNASELMQLKVLFQTSMIDPIRSMASSLDGQTLYAFTQPDDPTGAGQKSFTIFDISNYAAINKLGTMLMSYMTVTASTIKVTNDPSLICVSFNNKIYFMNVTDKKSPIVLNSILAGGISSFAYPWDSASNFLLLTDSYGGLNLFDLEIQHTFSLSTHEIVVGKKTVYDLTLLEKSPTGRYNIEQDDTFKFIEMTLYDFTISDLELVPVYPTLQSWMEFDKEYSMLTIQPDSKNHIDSYRIYSSVSRSLLHVRSDNTSVYYALIKAGYVGIDGFLTSSYSPGQPLLSLDVPTGSSGTAISEMLRNHYIEMIVPMTVESSLKLQKMEADTKYIQIDTESQFPVQVIITLFEDPKAAQADAPACRFLQDPLSTIRLNINPTYDTVILQGPLFDVNNVLQRIVIDLDENKVCNGNVTIDDGLNPAIINNMIPNISDYFELNAFPQLTVDLSLFQDEISSIPIYTGSHFTIIFNQSLFAAKNLEYSLGNTSNDMYWITLSGLSLSGTPPENLWPLRYNVEIVASSQFKHTRVPLTLHVKYGLSLILSIIGKLGLVVAIWIYLNIIINIVWKRYYRYPTDFTIKVGQEILPQTIVPVACIGKEFRESKFIFKELHKFVAQDLKCRSVNKTKLVEYFIDPTTQQIDRQKLLNAVEDTVKSLPIVRQTSIKHYIRGDDSRKQLTNQLVLNQVVMAHLSLKHEKVTKQAFERIKSAWTSLIEYSEAGPGWKLSINKKKVAHQLKLRNIDSDQIDEGIRSATITSLELMARPTMGRKRRLISMKAMLANTAQVMLPHQQFTMI